MKTSSFLLAMFVVNIVPSKLLAQSQLLIDPPTSLQLNLASIIHNIWGGYLGSGILTNGDYGMVVKFSEQGSVWGKYFNNSFVPILMNTTDGNIVVGGEGYGKAFVAKLDQDGQLIWFTNVSTGIESLTSILKDVSGNIYVGGQRVTSSNQFLTKVNSIGGIIWNKMPLSSLGTASTPKILLTSDSLVYFNSPFSGLAGDIEVRILDTNCQEIFHRTYGVPGNNREILTSVIRVANSYFVVVWRSNLGAIGIIVLDVNFNIVNSRLYTSPGGELESGRLLYDNGSLYMVCDRTVATSSPRVMAMKLDPNSLNLVWTKTLSSANSVPSSEPFMDGTLRVPYMRYPMISGAVRGVVLASLDPLTGNFTGTSCEFPTQFTVNAGAYTGLVTTNQPISTWADLTLSPNSVTLNNLPLSVEDCEPGILPIELLYFIGELVENGMVRLSWATTSEWQTSHFVIERSTDRFLWEELISVPATAVEQGTEYYSVDDDSPELNRTNYYRLSEVDVDGTVTPEGVVTVDLRGMSDHVCFKQVPVRVGEILDCQNVAWVKVFDMSGRLVLQARDDVVVRISPGQYLLTYALQSGKTGMRKMVIIN